MIDSSVGSSFHFNYFYEQTALSKLLQSNDCFHLQTHHDYCSYSDFFETFYPSQITTPVLGALYLATLSSCYLKQRSHLMTMLDCY